MSKDDLMSDRWIAERDLLAHKLGEIGRKTTEAGGGGDE